MADLCRRCGERAAAVNWVGDGGFMAWVHGGGARWCQLCATRAQLEHAEERAAVLPALRLDLARVGLLSVLAGRTLERVRRGGDERDERDERD